MRRQIEQSHQISFFQWVAHYPLIDALCYHIPNGGKRDKYTAMSLKRQGLKPGAPDIAIMIPLQGFHGLFIELKVKGGKLSESQKIFHQNLRQNDYKVEVCYSWFEAREVVLKYIQGSFYDKLLAI